MGREKRKSSFAWLPRLLVDAACLGQGGESGDISKANCRPRIVGEFPSAEGEEKSVLIVNECAEQMTRK